MKHLKEASAILMLLTVVTTAYSETGINVTHATSTRYIPLRLRSGVQSSYIPIRFRDGRQYHIPARFKDPAFNSSHIPYRFTRGYTAHIPKRLTSFEYYTPYRFSNRERYAFYTPWRLRLDSIKRDIYIPFRHRPK